ncbi:sugar efflux transporter for intercellular exchange domain-containing protein [Ditylenchus destructor]|nr:sugar efflux transporter for intercellular exchange domain-containing protein [Ditylenchus destructor]
MFDIIHEFSFINLLSLLAFFTTVGLFFCGIPICRQIWKRKDTTEISGAPFLMGVLGGTCWLTYGYLKKDDTVIYVTSAQIVLYSVYVVFYFFMTKKKFWISLKVLALVTTCAALVLSVHFFGHKIFHPLGIVCMTLNTADFGAPLAGLRVVIRRRATSTLPLPLCIANFLVSSEWKPNQRAPILRLYAFIRRCGSADRVTDIEQAAVVPVEKNEDEFRISKHRWSSRVISNIENEIDNVIQKVHLGDQFAYSNKLNKEEETISTDSVTLSPVIDDATNHGDTDSMENKPIVFPITIKDERQLMAMSRRLSSMSNTALASPQPPQINFNHSFAGTGHHPPKQHGYSLPPPPLQRNGGQRTTVDGWWPSATRISPFGFSFSGGFGGLTTANNSGFPQQSVVTIAEEDEFPTVTTLNALSSKSAVKRCISAPQLNKN